MSEQPAGEATVNEYDQRRYTLREALEAVRVVLTDSVRAVLTDEDRRNIDAALQDAPAGAEAALSEAYAVIDELAPEWSGSSISTVLRAFWGATTNERERAAFVAGYTWAAGDTDYDNDEYDGARAEAERRYAAGAAAPDDDWRQACRDLDIGGIYDVFRSASDAIRQLWQYICEAKEALPNGTRDGQSLADAIYEQVGAAPAAVRAPATREQDVLWAARYQMESCGHCCNSAALEHVTALTAGAPAAQPSPPPGDCSCIFGWDPRLLKYDPACPVHGAQPCEQQAQAGDEITAIMVSRSSDWDFSQVCPPEEEAAMRKRVARALNRLPYIDPYDDEDWLVDVVMRALWIGPTSLSLLRVEPSPDVADEQQEGAQPEQQQGNVQCERCGTRGWEWCIVNWQGITGCSRCMPNHVLAALSVPQETPLAKVLDALETLRDDVYASQRAHNCVGFDCATCTPNHGLHEAEKVLRDFGRIAVTVAGPAAAQTESEQ